MSADGVVLSLFPGIGLLDRAFELEGFCVVRGPDVLWGGDVKRFHPPAGVFAGVIGGPPCKAHSSLVHIVRARYGEGSVAEDLIPEYERIVDEAQPHWFLMENVPAAPEPYIPGYYVHSQVLNNRWLGEVQSRTRRFSFGTHYGGKLAVEMALFESPEFEYAVVAQKGGAGVGLKFDRGNTTRPLRTQQRRIGAASRPLGRLCELQGLPPDYLDAAPFTAAGKHEVLGNGVPIPMGRAIARAVRRALGLPLVAVEEAVS